MEDLCEFSCLSLLEKSEKRSRLVLGGSFCKRSKLQVVTPLPYYFPSLEMKTASTFNFSTKCLLANQDDTIKTYLKDFNLNRHNIHLVYEMLLEMEDLTCMAEFVPLVQRNVTLNRNQFAKEYWIQVKNCHIENVVVPFIDEAVIVSQESSLFSVFLKFKTDILEPNLDEYQWDDAIWRRTAIVQKIEKGRVYFRFDEGQDLPTSEIPFLQHKTYDIIFRSRRYPVRYQHNALNLLRKNREMREYLFPAQKPNNELDLLTQFPLDLFNKTISANREQLIAVQSIVGGPNVNAPFIIFGPPGTGKTTVVVESILQLFLRNPTSRILVTASSNSTCDTIALRLCKFFDTCLPPRREKSLLRIYSKNYFEKNSWSIDANLLKYSNVDIGQYLPSIKEIHENRIIVAALSTVGKLVTCDVGRNNFFTHIFLDEAGATTIPEALIAIMGIKSRPTCRFILSGDHKQLGPVVRSERAAQLGLSLSLMEHLLKFDCYAMCDNDRYDYTLQARLRRNYRSHPEILRLFNHLFYNNELIAAAKEEHVNMAAKLCGLPNPKFPIIFQAVHGATKKDKDSYSSFNRLEVDMVEHFLHRLLSFRKNAKKVNQTDIGIITPYKSQNKHIQARLKHRRWFKVESGSVEAFQGREKQIIIVSLVKSFTNLGFVSNPKRLNVLLSRPQSLLILIGNPLSLRRNSNFAFILDECERHGTFLSSHQTKKKKK